MSNSLAIVRMAYSPYGGAETSIEQLRKALSVDSHTSLSLTMVTQSWTPAADQKKPVPGYKTLPPSGLTRASRFKNFTQSVQRLIKESQFDITQTHERIPGCDIFRAGDGVHASWLNRLAASRRVPVGWLRLDPYHRMLLNAEKSIAQDGTVIVANSVLVRNELIQMLGADPQNVRVIPNIIASVLDKLPSSEVKQAGKRALELDSNKPVVLFVGSGFERKGAFKLVQAALQNADLQILIVGNDRKPAKLQNHIKTLGLTGRVRWCGPQTDLKPYWLAADVFCLPSLYDSFPNAALEALAHGIPCVLTDGAGITDEWVAAGVALKAKRDPLDLADSIRTMLEDLSHYQSRALEKARSLSPERIMPLWLRLYEEILERKR